VGAARLFGHYDPEELDTRRAAPFLIGRLLEDGDGADLRWLAGTYPEAELATWLTRHGARALSARSLAFWWTVLAEGTLLDEGPRFGGETVPSDGDYPAASERESPDLDSRSSRASLPPGGAAVGEGGRPGWGRVRSSRRPELWPL
jgi:hypothetical protein